MKRFISIILLISMTLSMASCGFFSKDNNLKTEEPIPYLENYLDIEPTDSYQYEKMKYTNAKSKPIIMGGNYYHGGFTIGHTVGPYTPGYATFDVSSYDGKTLAFVMGSVAIDYNDDDRFAYLSVYADGTQVIDAAVKANEAPQRYTLNLTGVKELSFKILEGYCEVGVAELTVWDGEAVQTGPAIADTTAKLQLVKDILPFFFELGTSIHTQREVTAQQVTDSYGLTETIAYRNVKSEAVSVGGYDQNEAFTMYKSIPIAGKDIDYACFYTEGKFAYLSFTVGCDDEANGKAGKSWLSVYADGKRVLEEQVISNELPKQYVVPINNCHTLRFETSFEEGGEHYVTVYNAFVGKTEADVLNEIPGGDLGSLPDVCKLISNIKPYAVASHATDPLFDGATEHKTFSMSGRKYNEGVVLYAKANMLFGNSGSHACFNLEGEFKYLTFVVGLLDKTSIVSDDTLKIYLDGKLEKTIQLYALKLPQEHTVDLKNCKELKIELVGKDAMVRPAFGIAEMVVYKDKIVENDLFARPDNNYPDKMPLIENIKPYMTYVSSKKFVDSSVQDYHTQVVFDGSTKQNYFTVNGEKKYSGVLLETSVHMDLAGVLGGADMSSLIVAEIFMPWFLGGASLLAADIAKENAFTAFDLQGEFKTVTFTVADTNSEHSTGMSTQDKLFVGTNEKLMKEITLTKGMSPQTYTVNIENTEQLVFWLACNGSSSPEYAIYDIVVEK